MLDYYKVVLGKVSFDQRLFQKELQKAMMTLMDHERLALNNWLQSMDA